MNLTAKPLLSVVMPVRNSLPFLDASITSILKQTLSDFEFVILDDASTDGSLELLREWSHRDERIRLYESKTHLGIPRSLNSAVSKARSSILARMDADDIAHPDRLRRQWNIIKSRPDVAVVGTLCNGIDAKGRVVRPRDRWRIVRRSAYIPFPHGSAVFRRKVFDDVGGYNESYFAAEDQDLFSRMATRGAVLTLPDLLYSYRYHSCNKTQFDAIRAVSGNPSHDGNVSAAFYMLGAMRLWAGYDPSLVKPLLQKKLFNWDRKTPGILAAAICGSISPSALRCLLRSSIRARDLLASVRVKDGIPYEWRY